MEEYIYENIILLDSPIGTFSVCQGKGKIPFNVRKNNYNVPYYELTTETNFALDIDTRFLSIGKQYDIVFSEGGLHFKGSDEHTESITTTIGKCSIGIGCFDMNDNYFYPDKKHIGYDVWRSEDNLGFSFVLLDRTVEKITFLIAWIEHSENQKIDYEEALNFWLT